MRTSTRARIASVTVAASIGVFGLASSASAAPEDPSNDLNQSIRDLTCEPEGSILRPTSACSVYDPDTEQSTNPYTDDGQSPGILGLGFLGVL